MRVLIGILTTLVVGTIYFTVAPSMKAQLDAEEALTLSFFFRSSPAVDRVRALLETRMKTLGRHELDKLANLIVHLSRSEKIPEDLILSVIQVESGFQPAARSPKGAMGLMQLMPETGEWLAQRFGIRWMGDATLSSAEANVYLGVKYLAFLRQKYHNDLELMLSAYNRGPAKVDEELNDRRALATVGYYRRITEEKSPSTVVELRRMNVD